MAVTFDGPNKEINITTTGTYSVTTDIYSEWKRWVQLSDNAKYLPAFDITGGDPVGTSNLDGYVFIRTDNGWAIRAPEASGTVSLNGQLWPKVPGAAYLLPPVGSFTVVFETQLSALAYKVVTGSGLSTQEHDQLMVLDTENVDLAKVNGTAVTGVGSAGDPWGPV